MSGQAAVILLLSGALALATSAQEQNSSPMRPWVINSTYTVTIPREITITVHLHEQNGQLTIDEKSTKWGESSWAVKYAEVNYVEVVGSLYDFEDRKRTVRIGSYRIGRYDVTLPSETEAEAVAECIARKASLPLELIAGVWRVRKPFECPEAGQPGCRDFKELLDHDDPDIAEYFYSSDEDEPVYACFDDEESHFLMVKYSRYDGSGRIDLESFRNGQSKSWEHGKIEWSSPEFGEIIQLGRQKQGQEAQTLGLIDSSSLSYHTKFANRMSTATQYELNIRWSTGRYTETWSGKNEGGKPFSDNSSGICVKLN